MQVPIVRNSAVLSISAEWDDSVKLRLARLRAGSRAKSHRPNSRSSTRAILRSPCSEQLDLLGLWGRSRRFTHDEENRAFCSLEQFRRHLTEEKLAARPRADTHHQETVTADVELTENGFLRVRTLRTAPFTSTP
jgi:hypothetical protein